ncbi:predicted protein [Nematostella vectensis]|uniref:C-factor n=1 Tax=Nematostella vectensis TaxID=45351 RepID=A7SZQ6_NEMVE|nr:predicted protein [Nematostella vectensis]|eukprot:XP_001622907.1 predicted protein [Nematostella vectensis]
MAVPRCNIFITGCNRGLGLEFVKQFLRSKNPPEHLIATCRSLAGESASELKKLAAENQNLHLLELEVTDFQAIQRCAEQTREIVQEKGLHILVNNAGILDPAGLLDVTEEQMIRVFKANTVAPLQIVQAFLPLLKQGGKTASFQDQAPKFPNALIVQMSTKIASIQDNRPGGLYPGGLYPYRASKSALNIVSKSMSVDLKGDGISVVILHPGWVQTDMGGPNASMAIEESVAGMLSVLANFDESKNGMFIDFKGNIVPW